MNNNKKVLITAGSTWIPIDKVRVITNVFGGKLGIRIAKEFIKNGFDVTLLLGNSRVDLEEEFLQRVNLLKFRYFNDLYDIIENDLDLNDYDIVIHSAAISDYQVVNNFSGKMKSGKDELILKLIPTRKIVNIFKEKNPNLFLVMFKLEVDKDKNALINIARSSMAKAKADMVIANDFNTLLKGHRAYIIYGDNIGEYLGKDDISRGLVNIIKNVYR